MPFIFGPDGRRPTSTPKPVDMNPSLFVDADDGEAVCIPEAAFRFAPALPVHSSMRPCSIFP